MALAIEIDRDRIAAFCRRRKVTEFSFFGSVLRGDFSRESDVDVLVSFAPDSHWSLFDLMDMEDELAELFGRKVDLVSRNGLRNPFRRHEILEDEAGDVCRLRSAARRMLQAAKNSPKASRTRSTSTTR